MHAPAGRRGRRAQKDVRRRRGIGIDTRHGTKKQLGEVWASSADVAADIVWVVVLQVPRSADEPREDPSPKARSEPLDMRFDGWAAILD